MIPNHAQFLTAITDQKKVCVRYYSTPDSGVLDRVCAPMEYGPGETPDGRHRYWLWDYAGEPGAQRLGLVPDQILDVQVLGELFNPSEFIHAAPAAPALAGELPPASVTPSPDAKTPIL